MKLNRALIAAAAISLAWHAFWMFGVKVAIAPKTAGCVKYSKVSFLGPILERGALEVRMAPSERTFLEKRYLAMISKKTPVLTEDPALPEASDLAETDIHSASRAALVSAVRDALSSSKLEPDYRIE